jgi:hypothetical protein
MDIQKRYQGKKMTNEEAEIRTPQEEAHRIHFFESDKISFSYPLNWYFLLPFFFIMHWAILGTCAWCIFATPIGRISILGLFLREIFPILCLVYVGYILFSLLPKIIRLFRYESMDDQGLILRGNLLPWEDIQLIVPYTDVHKKERIAIYDNKGKQLLELRQEMSDFPYIWNKIKEKVKKNTNRRFCRIRCSQFINTKIYSLDKIVSFYHGTHYFNLVAFYCKLYCGTKRRVIWTIFSSSYITS